MPHKPPVIIDHDSTAAEKAMTEIERLLRAQPDYRKPFLQRFTTFSDCFIYKRISALRANRCKAGFQPTEALREFLAALGANKLEVNGSFSNGHKRGQSRS